MAGGRLLQAISCHWDHPLEPSGRPAPGACPAPTAQLPGGPRDARLRSSSWLSSSSSWGCMLLMDWKRDSTAESLVMLRPRTWLLFMRLTKVLTAFCRAFRNCAWLSSDSPFWNCCWGRAHCGVPKLPSQDLPPWPGPLPGASTAAPAPAPDRGRHLGLQSFHEDWASCSPWAPSNPPHSPHSPPPGDTDRPPLHRPGIYSSGNKVRSPRTDSWVALGTGPLSRQPGPAASGRCRRRGLCSASSGCVRGPSAYLAEEAAGGGYGLRVRLGEGSLEDARG